MDNEIVIIGENMMIRPKTILNFFLRNHFHEQCEAIQKNCHGMSVTPSLPPSSPPPNCCQQHYIFISWKIGMP